MQRPYNGSGRPPILPAAQEVARWHDNGTMVFASSASTSATGGASTPHSWHLNFKLGDRHFRFSLDRHIHGKTEAVAAAEKIRVAIRDGTELRPQTANETPTVPGAGGMG